MNQYPNSGPMATYQTNPSNGYPAQIDPAVGRMTGFAGQDRAPAAGYYGGQTYQVNMKSPENAMQQPSDAMQPDTLQMTPSVPQDVVEFPQNAQEAYEGSIKALLGKNIGHYVVATFLIGTQECVVWEGFLQAVGNDYLVLYQPAMDRYVTCDLYSLKFTEFYDKKGTIPGCAGYHRWEGTRLW